MVCGRFGRSKREAEDFVGSFVDVSITQRLRVMGDDVRLFKCYPGNWQARSSKLLPSPYPHCPAPKHLYIVLPPASCSVDAQAEPSTNWWSGLEHHVKE